MKVLFPAPGGPDSPILNAMLALPLAAACWRQCAMSVVTRWRDWAPAPARLDSTSVMPRAAEGGEVRHVTRDTRHATRAMSAVAVTHLARLCPRCRCPPPAAVSWRPWRGIARCCRHSRSGTGCRRAAASQAAVVTSHDESLVSIENFQTCSVFKIEDIKTLPLTQTQSQMCNVRACLW